jgi:hypothetical protein
MDVQLPRDYGSRGNEEKPKPGHKNFKATMRE